jgi:four helix bundle protein
MLKNFRTYHLAVEFYSLTQTLRLPRHLKDQLARASSSIVLNLAEGASRQSLLERKRFFNIAFGSVRESQAILDLSYQPSQTILDTADKLAAHVYKLMQNARG